MQDRIMTIAIVQCLILVFLSLMMGSVYWRILRRQKKNKQIIQNLINKLKNSGELNKEEIKKVYAEIDAIPGRFSRMEFRGICEIHNLIEEKSSVQEPH